MVKLITWLLREPSQKKLSTLNGYGIIKFSGWNLKFSNNYTPPLQNSSFHLWKYEIAEWYFSSEKHFIELSCIAWAKHLMNGVHLRTKKQKKFNSIVGIYNKKNKNERAKKQIYPVPFNWYLKNVQYFWLSNEYRLYIHTYNYTLYTINFTRLYSCDRMCFQIKKELILFYILISSLLVIALECYWI